MDLNVRKLRYFVVLAEELHFTRAAARLLLAQQSLSRQIKELEDELGTPLFVRTRRSVALTPAGRTFLRRASRALHELDAGVEEARRQAAGGARQLRIGFGTGAALELTPMILEEFARCAPDVEVEMREYPLPDQTAGLRDGWADVAFVRPPLAQGDIVWEALFVEPRVLSVSARHPLAGRGSVQVADILSVPLAVGRSDDEAYRRFWSLGDFRSGSTLPLLTATTTNTEELELVAAGLACTVNPAAMLRYLPHPLVRFVPISDVPGSAVAIAWRDGPTSSLVAQFRACAGRVRDREVEVVAAIEDPFGAAAGVLSVG